MTVRFLDRTLSEQVGDKAVELCSPMAFISWLPHLIHVRIGQAPGQERVISRVLESSPSVLILQFLE